MLFREINVMNAQKGPLFSHIMVMNCFTAINYDVS